MRIAINTNKVEPIYEQLVDQIQQAVLDQKLEAGAMLASIRQLASDLEINHNTVAKAYQILERSGVINMVGRKGAFVTIDAIIKINESAQADVALRFKEVIVQALQRGFSRKKINSIFNEMIKDQER